MGAGISKAREYRIVYRELHRIRRELAVARVESRYKDRALHYDYPGVFPSVATFSIAFARQNASNGECCLYPVISITDATGAHATYCGISQDAFTYNAGIARIIYLFADGA